MYEFTPINRIISIESVVTGIDVVRPKNFFFPGEMHDFWEAVLVLEGKAIATGDAKVYNLSAGQLLFHKPLEFHRIWSAEQSQPHLMIISFRAQGDGMRFFAERCFNIDLAGQKVFKNICGLIRKTVKAYRTGDKNYSLYSSRTAAALEEFLLSITNDDALVPEEPTTEEKKYREIVRIMDEHCCESLSVNDLSRLCNMSVSSMKRFFGRFSDVGVAKFFLSLKIRRAMQLLDEGKNACEVANLVGFDEVSYFHTAFKRETGVTPIKYQKTGK